MLPVGHDNQRFIKEDLLSLPERHPMELPVLLEISVVPIETGAALKRVSRHGSKYIPDIYASATPSGEPNGLRLSGARKGVRCSRGLDGRARAEPFRRVSVWPMVVITILPH